MKKILLAALSISIFTIQSCVERNIENKNNTSIEFANGALPAQLHHPESVWFDGNQYIYVSDIGQNLTPHLKDGDGKIVKLNKKGEIIATNIANTTLNAPKGFVVIGNEMYINDIDAIKVINLSNGNLIKTIDFSDIGVDLTAAGGTGLNDMCLGLNKDIYVSVTNNGAIYKVNTESNVKTLITNSPAANGLYFDKTQSILYVDGYNTAPSLGKFNLTDNTYSLLNAPNAKGGYDGLAMYKNQLWLTDWGAGANGSNEVGVLAKYDLETQTFTEMPLNKINKTHLNGPADISIFNDYLFIPAMGEGKIYVYSLK